MAEKLDKLLAFLGATSYQETDYQLGEAITRTRFASEPLVVALKPAQTLVFLTTGAREKNWDALRKRLDPLTSLHDVDIPDGQDESELWRIFDAVVGAVEEGDAVAFDITSGLRSLPFISFLAIAYLRVAKRVDVRGVYYGAFEVRKDDITSMFDLTPFVTLLDWTTAVDRFLRTGNAAQLAELLRDAHRQPYLRGEGDLPRRLQGMANTVETLSEAMLLGRPLEVMPLAQQFGAALEAARDEVPKWARPFSVLLEHTRASYAPFALDDPMKVAADNLRVQLRLVRWYIEHERVMQAYLLAREWVVSLVAYRLGRDLIADRDEVEDLLNAAHRLAPNGSVLPPELAREAHAADIIRTWGQVRDLRNDLLHAGMKAVPKRVKTFVHHGNRLHADLAALAPDLAD